MPTNLFNEDFVKFQTSPKGSSTSWATSLVPQTTRDLAGQQCFYSDASVGVNPFATGPDGLTITAAPCEPASNPLGLPYTSGVITSIDLFAFTFGTVNITAKMPAGPGWWPGLWLLPASHYWTAELDIMEAWEGDVTEIHNTVQGWADWPTEENWINNSKPAKVGDISANFKTYSLDWDPDFCTFSCNGEVLNRLVTPPAAVVPMYLVLNLGVSKLGGWLNSEPQPGAVGQMQVKSINVAANSFTK